MEEKKALNKGRRVRPGDPIYEKIYALHKENAEKDIPYPSKIVDDLYAYDFVWYGRVPYDAKTLCRLQRSRAARSRPLILPEGYRIDGVKRLPGETKGQYTKYLAYRDLGPERTYAAAAALCYPPNTSDGKRWGMNHDFRIRALRFHWEERVAAWDAQIEIEARQTMESVKQEQIRDYIERRDAYLQSEQEIIEVGVKRIKQMLSFPPDGQRIVTERDADGREVTVTVIEPAKWTYASLSQFIAELQKIGRLHFGLPTSNNSTKIEASVTQQDRERQNRSPIPPEEQAAHDYASLEAEKRYFAALEEYKDRHQEPERITATIAAD